MNKIIVLDLDGTLLREDKTVSQYTIDILLKFKEKNNKILFATARPPRDAYKYIPENLRDNPIICYNGACILNGKEILNKKQLSKKQTLEIVEIINKLGYNQISIEIEDTLYSNFDTVKFFRNPSKKILDFHELNFESAYKILVFNRDCIKENLVIDLPNYCKGVITDNATICQISSNKASKWNAVKTLAKKLEIQEKNIIAFGDDYNDFELIKNAGISVAMGNAIKDIKEIADYITDTNDNDGIAKYIEKQFL